MQRVLSQSITLFVESKRRSTPVGFVQAYGLNLHEGWCYSLAYTSPEYRRGFGAEATAGLLEYLFSEFPLRKVYADVLEFDMDTIKPLLGAGFVEEGRFREHVWHGEQYWDMYRFAIYREAWQKFQARGTFSFTRTLDPNAQPEDPDQIPQSGALPEPA